ncbi:MAG: PHP domain-containing protein [Proteobacteria bacterium]|nr:PHP domain-containing protein [Pseudomonadota bacterium]
MNRCYDLHTHTYYSDGLLSPAELVTKAADAGVEVLALTDHDTTTGLAEAAEAANTAGIELIPGVEISALWSRKTIHVVGLQVDPENEVLAAGLAGSLETRNQRAEIMSAKLVKKGFEDIDASVKKQVRGPIISRTHYARALVEAGHAKDIPQAFKRYLAGGKAGYAATEWAELEQVIGWIHAAGGYAVIAHPGRYKMGSGRLRAMFGEFAEHGGDAIEVISGSQHPDETERMARFAAEFSLMASVGSDYHGPEQRWLSLGRLPRIPAACRPLWSQWL